MAARELISDTPLRERYTIVRDPETVEYVEDEHGHTVVDQDKLMYQWRCVAPGCCAKRSFMSYGSQIGALSAALLSRCHQMQLLDAPRIQTT